jgi:hypothetical protein
MCVCTHKHTLSLSLSLSLTHTHKHIHTYIHTYIHIEDLYYCLYYFAFPGTWGETEWIDDKFNQVPLADPKKQSMVTLEQKRQFYRLPYVTSFPRYGFRV